MRFVESVANQDSSAIAACFAPEVEFSRTAPAGLARAHWG
jgi:hypothetical protein